VLVDVPSERRTIGNLETRHMLTPLQELIQ
jgi:hypothetical protein